MLHILLLSTLLRPAATLAVPGSGTAAATKLPFGRVITGCAVPNSFALTFDDGPHIFTKTLLDTLKQADIKATFFVNGDNFGKIEDRKEELHRMMNEGHQIGSHTFRHPDLRNISEAEVRSEMTLLDAKLKQLVGVTPTYMRPPFFRTNNETLRILGEMRYHVINANIDTLDFENTKPETNDKSFDTYKRLFNNGSISLMHDVHNTTVNQLVPNVISFLQKQCGRTSMTVGECLGDPKENWYRSDTIGGAVVQGPQKQTDGKSCGCQAA